MIRPASRAEFSHILSHHAVLLSLIMAAAFVLFFDSVQKWHGDAIIHLSIAELLASGKGLTFNHGEPVVATTSLLWTGLLTLCFLLFGSPNALWAVKGLSILAWALATIATYVLFARAAPERPWLGIGAAALFTLTPGIAEHLFGGMEAGMAAFLFTLGAIPIFTPRRSHALFPALIVACLATLTRPEGAIFFGIMALYAWKRLEMRQQGIALLIGVGIGLLLTVAITYSVTGSWAMDSGISRKAWAMRQSWTLGGLFFDYRSVAMFAAYAPILLVGLGSIAVRLFRPAQDQSAQIAPDQPTFNTEWRHLAQLTVLMAAVMLVFYSVILGSPSPERYWLPFMPLLFGVGLRGFVGLVHGLRNRYGKPLAWVAVGAAVLWLGVVYGVEYSDNAGYPHTDLIRAVTTRVEREQSLRESLGIAPAVPFTMAMQEIQYRFFLPLETPITVLSLDGRTVAHFGPYVDPGSGVRNFEQLFSDQRPDFVTTHGFYLPVETIMHTLQLNYRQARGRPVVAGGFVFHPTNLPDLYRVIYPN